MAGTTTNHAIRYPTSGDNVAPLATHFENLADDVDTLLGAWAAYTPAWTGSTGNPSLGNGTLTGRYCRIGDLVVCQGRLIAGSTTTFGSGTYSISLPVTSANAFGSNGIIGSAWLRDASGNDYQMQLIDVGTTFSGRPGAATFGGNSAWAATTPMTMANGDWVSWHCLYEAAA